MLPIVTPADLSQSLVKAAAARKQKMAPEAGAIKFRSSKARSFFGSRPFAESLYFQGLETKTGQVAVADGNAAAGGQQAVDRSHTRANRVVEGRRLIGAVLDMDVPFSWSRNHSAS
jgi:hypothetical protein